jgi:putative Mg2+ transporter-C (MgtC) family protein
MSEFEFILQKILIAALLGASMGLERGMAGKDASLRTFSLISIGSCVFTILSLNSMQGFRGPDPSRIAAQIVSGVGFLGAGVIFRSHHGVQGLTTAAMIWVTAAIGTAVGFNRMDVAFAGTLVSIVVLLVFRILHDLFGNEVKGKDVGKEPTQ